MIIHSQSLNNKQGYLMRKTKSIFLAIWCVLLLATAVSAQRGGKIVLYKFFDEKYRQGGYDYTYPPAAKIGFDNTTGYKSKTSLKVQLVNSDYSGASVCLNNEVFDLSAHRWSSTLEFMIKGEKGGEQILIGLIDEKLSDDKQTQTKLTINRYVEGGSITTDWKRVAIPIADFIDRGLYYDAGAKVELPALIEWNKIAEFRVSADKGVNKGNAVVWVDDIQIVKSPAVTPRVVKYWDFIEETIDAPKDAGKYKKNEKVLGSVFVDDFSPGGIIYGYGGKTTARTQKSSTPGNTKVLSLYMDDQDWSGVTASLGKTIDLSAVRNSGGLYFWMKGAVGGEKGWIGIMDDQGNEIQVQTKLSWNDWGNVEKDWNHFKIPLKRFLDNGLYWDAQKQTEVAKSFNWKKVSAIRFSIGKEFNIRALRDGAVTVYVDQLEFVDKCDWSDPDVYWDTFTSKEADYLLHDFENETVALWEPSHGPKSRVKIDITKGKLDGKSLHVNDYLLGDWVDAVADYQKQGIKFPFLRRDWTKHWGIAFEVYTDKPWQGITVQIGDSGDELYVANTGIPKGRHKVMIPFRNFNKFPYYQPPHAVQNNKFDLDNIYRLDFKPSGEGTRGSFQIDNVYLTNMRSIEVKKGPAQAPFEIAGDFNKVITQKINPGIHGINAALWDGDLLRDETIKYVKDVPHNVVRYPGGLRADDDDWEEILANKDWMVDTDEFLDWCKKTNSEAMITVNFGKGTPEQAARWVHHTNIKRKANVKYWEIGNELYGNWHVNYDEYGADMGHAYGKRTAEFIKAMKAVDPTIQVTFVGVLEGEWNENVLKYVKDLADGINVHHYPQHYGEENDFALLASPQSLNGIIPGVRDQLKKHGAPGKEYSIWLTEWNSVDFNPGPQTISLTNGLFVADYLGMLAVHNIEIANYWDIHNSMTPEGGDYGYLTRTGDPLGDNVPRPSYWAFKMAAHSLQGTLVETKNTNDEMSTYLTSNGKTKSLLIINKSKDTKYQTKLNIPGFAGKATIEILDASNELKGPKSVSKQIKQGDVIDIPKFSIAKITLQ
jgi:alpha-L-arabinofuranosidase